MLFEAKFIRVRTVGIMLMAALSCQAQETEITTASRYVHSFGIRGTFDLNIPGKWTSTDKNAVDSDNFGYGLAAGVVYNIMRDRHWFLESGLQFSYNEFGINILTDGYYADSRISKYDIIIPLNAGYQFDLFDKMGMNVMTGVEGTICLGGSISNMTDYSLFGSHGIWRRGDLKWGVGAGFVWNDISINVMSYFGFINQLKQKDLSLASVINENVVRVSLTYYYRL